MPVAKFPVAAWKVVDGIRHALFAKKLQLFLEAASLTSGASDHDWHTALRNMGSDEQRKDLGEMMMLLLDRFEDTRKAEIVGRIVKSLMLGQIDYATCKRLCGLVDRLLLDDVEVLRELQLPRDERNCSLDESGLWRLQSLGVAYMDTIVFDPTREEKPSIPNYAVLPMGEMLLKYI